MPLINLLTRTPSAGSTLYKVMTGPFSSPTSFAATPNVDKAEIISSPFALKTSSEISDTLSGSLFKNSTDGNL